MCDVDNVSLHTYIHTYVSAGDFLVLYDLCGARFGSPKLLYTQALLVIIYVYAQSTGIVLFDRSNIGVCFTV